MKIHRSPHENYENHEIHKTPCENYDKHNNHRNAHDNNENHETNLEFESRIMELMRIITKKLDSNARIKNIMTSKNFI